MRCPYCGGANTKVLESRQTEEGRSIRRRRECSFCDSRFTTYERVERMPLFVIKKDGRREAFDSEKILKGLLKACEKRPVSFERLKQIADEVESELLGRMEPEVPSSLIGELVMDKLKDVDDVAYVRFASVYREFQDIDLFIREVQKIIRSKEKKGGGSNVFPDSKT